MVSTCVQSDSIASRQLQSTLGINMHLGMRDLSWDRISLPCSICKYTTSLEQADTTLLHKERNIFMYYVCRNERAQIV